VAILFFIFAAVKVPALGILLFMAAVIGLTLAGLPLGVRRRWGGVSSSLRMPGNQVPSVPPIALSSAARKARMN
jgi:hypothetical protein